MEEEVYDLRLILSSSSEGEEEVNDVKDDLINTSDKNVEMLETVAVINKPFFHSHDQAWGVKRCCVKLRRVNLVQVKKKVKSVFGRYERRGMSKLRTDSKTLWSRMRLSMLVWELSGRVEDEDEIERGEKRMDVRRIGVKKVRRVDLGLSGEKSAWMDEATRPCQVDDLERANSINLSSTGTDPPQNLIRPSQVKLKRLKVSKLYCQQEDYEECVDHICDEGHMVDVTESKAVKSDQGKLVTSSTFRECDLSSAGKFPSLSEGHFLTQEDILLASSQFYADEIRLELEIMERVTEDDAGTNAVKSVEEELLRGLFNNTKVQPNCLNLEREIPELLTESISLKSIPIVTVIDSFDDVDLVSGRKLFEGWSFEDANMESDTFDELSSFIESSLVGCGESSDLPKDGLDTFKHQDANIWVATTENVKIDKELGQESEDPLSKLEEFIPLPLSQNEVDNVGFEDEVLKIEHKVRTGVIKGKIQDRLYQEQEFHETEDKELDILGNCLPTSTDSSNVEAVTRIVNADKRLKIMNETKSEVSKDPKSIENMYQEIQENASLKKVDDKANDDGVNTRERREETILLEGTIHSLQQDLFTNKLLVMDKTVSKYQEQGFESSMCSETDIGSNKMIDLTFDYGFKEDYVNKTRSQEEMLNKVEDADEGRSHKVLDNQGIVSITEKGSSQEEKIDPFIENKRNIQESSPLLSPDKFVEDVEEWYQSNDDDLSLCEQVENVVKDNNDAILAKNNNIEQAKEIGAKSQEDEDNDDTSDDDLILCEEVDFSFENLKESENDTSKEIASNNSQQPDEIKTRSKDVMNTNNGGSEHFILYEHDVAENTEEDYKKVTINVNVAARKKSVRTIDNNIEPTDGKSLSKRSIFDISFDELPNTGRNLALPPKIITNNSRANSSLCKYDLPQSLKVPAKEIVKNSISSSNGTKDDVSDQAAVSGQVNIIPVQALVVPPVSQAAFAPCPHQSPSVTSSTGPSVLHPPNIRESFDSATDDSSSSDDVIILEETEIVETAEVNIPSLHDPIGTSNEHSCNSKKILPYSRSVITNVDVNLWEKLEPAKLKSKLLISNKKHKENMKRHGKKKGQIKMVESRIKNVEEEKVLTKPTEFKEKKHAKYKEYDKYHKCGFKSKSKEPTTSTSSHFKIPKVKTKMAIPCTVSTPSLLSGSKETSKTVEVSHIIQDFLVQEGIFDTKDGDWLNFDSVYDEVESVKRATNSRILATDDNAEVVDLERQGQDLKKLKTDKERKRFALTQFRNPISSDPARNLQYHGFRSLKDGDARSKIQNSSSFSISLGKLEPLPGYKRKREDMDGDDIVGEGKMKLTDFGCVMKKVFVYKFKQKMNPAFGKLDRADLEDFKTYLGHYKAGLEETANFLSYYNSKEELELSQTKEVIDLENQFSTFSNYYGAADEEFFCKDCNKKHKFCQ